MTIGRVSMLGSKDPKLHKAVCLGTTVSDWLPAFSARTVVISALEVRAVQALHVLKLSMKPFSQRVPGPI